MGPTTAYSCTSRRHNMHTAAFTPNMPACPLTCRCALHVFDYCAAHALLGSQQLGLLQLQGLVCVTSLLHCLVLLLLQLPDSLHSSLILPLCPAASTNALSKHAGVFDNVRTGCHSYCSTNSLSLHKAASNCVSACQKEVGVFWVWGMCRLEKCSVTCKSCSCVAACTPPPHKPMRRLVLPIDNPDCICRRQVVISYNLWHTLHRGNQ